MSLPLWARRLRHTSVVDAGRPPGSPAPRSSAGAPQEVLMRALHAVRSAPVRVSARLQSAQQGDAGMTTAEYAVGTVAACGFSGILYKVITSPQVLELVTGIISRAFKLAF
jgi:hypothetical protein